MQLQESEVLYRKRITIFIEQEGYLSVWHNIQYEKMRFTTKLASYILIFAC